jgi:hypothetical protein
VVSEPVELASAIQALRQQLAEARRVGWFDELGFVMEPVELTIQAVVEKDANGKVGWGILGVGGGYQSTTTQTLKLTLTPVRRGPNGTLTRNFTIADQQEAEPVFGEARPTATPTRGVQETEPVFGEPAPTSGE